MNPHDALKERYGIVTVQEWLEQISPTAKVADVIHYMVVVFGLSPVQAGRILGQFIREKWYEN